MEAGDAETVTVGTPALGAGVDVAAATTVTLPCCTWLVAFWFVQYTEYVEEPTAVGVTFVEPEVEGSL